MGLGRQWLRVFLGDCTCTWQGGVWMCFRWEEWEKLLKNGEFRQVV